MIPDREPFSEAENRRFYVRLHEPGSEQALIRIVMAAGQGTSLKPGLIQILDISPGGCGFYSALHFPVPPRLMCLIEWEAEGERFRLPGRLRWRNPDENGYRYGIRFQLGFYERLRLHHALNRQVLRLCPGQAKIHHLYRSHER